MRAQGVYRTDILQVARKQQQPSICTPLVCRPSSRRRPQALGPRKTVPQGTRAYTHVGDPRLQEFYATFHHKYRTTCLLSSLERGCGCECDQLRVLFTYQNAPSNHREQSQSWASPPLAKVYCIANVFLADLPPGIPSYPFRSRPALAACRWPFAARELSPPDQFRVDVVGNTVDDAMSPFQLAMASFAGRSIRRVRADAIDIAS